MDPLSRRGFIGWLAALPLVGKAVIDATTPSAELIDFRPRVYEDRGTLGMKTYMCIRADGPILRGEAVYFQNTKGVATSNIDRGNYGFMEIVGS